MKRDSPAELSIVRLEYFLLGRVNLGRDSLLDSHRIECRSELSNRTVSESILLIVILSIQFFNSSKYSPSNRIVYTREEENSEKLLNQRS